MQSVGSKAEWVAVSVSTVALLSLAFGGYGHMAGESAVNRAEIRLLKSESKRNFLEHKEINNELDGLWEISLETKNRIEAFDKSFDRFSDAVDKLSNTVIRLEEREKIKGGVQ